MSREPDNRAIFNPDDYREDLGAFELTKEQENELLQTLWNIMSMMVDLGWGLDSVQLFDTSNGDKFDAESGDTVKQIEQLNIFNTASASGEKGYANDE